MTSPRLKRRTDDVSVYSEPKPLRLEWVTSLEKVKCRLGHAIAFTMDKFLIEYESKTCKQPIVRSFTFCETCEARHGAETYQVGFFDLATKQVRWYAVPDLERYRELNGFDGRMTEAMTKTLLEQWWREHS